MAKTKKQLENFIIKTLLPYKEDPDKCATTSKDSGICVYLTEDGRKCAVGRWLKKGEWQDWEVDVTALRDRLYRDKGLELKDVLLKEAREIFESVHDPITLFTEMQSYHDCLTTFRYYKSGVNRSIISLEDEFELDLQKLKL